MPSGGKSVPRYLYLQSDPTGTPAEYPCPSRATSVVSRSHHGHNSRLTRDGASMEYLDLTPWRCPEPLIRLKLWLRGAQAGQSLLILLKDPGSRQDIPAWLLRQGHQVQRLQESDAALTLRLVVQNRPS